MILQMNVYLLFDGRCKEAFEFYAKVFKTQIESLTTYGEQEEMSFVKEANKEKVLHSEMYLTNETKLNAADYIPELGNSSLKIGTNMSLVLVPESEEETRRIFEELSVDGKIEVQLEKTFWNSLYAKFLDKFGVEWMLNYSYE